MLIKIFVRTFPSAEDCELFESILETRWPNLLQEVKGVRFRALKNPQTPNVSVVLWEFPDNEAMKKIEKHSLISLNRNILSLDILRHYATEFTSRFYSHFKVRELINNLSGPPHTNSARH